MQLPAPVVKVYFAMVDMDQEVGPPRFLPGTHELTAKQDRFLGKATSSEVVQGRIVTCEGLQSSKLIQQIGREEEGDFTCSSLEGRASI
jgi:hypothetical protein